MGLSTQLQSDEAMMDSRSTAGSVSVQRRGFFAKFRGDGAALPARPTVRAVALAGAGGFLAIASLVWLTSFSSTPLILGSFGATCVLIFGFPDAPFSQPRNVVIGHALSSAIGLAALTLFGAHWWAAGLAAGAAIAAMMATRTVHPPAGSNPVIVFMSQPGWGFLIYPTLVGALLLAALALVFNNSTRKAGYPKYW
jgi:CBS-domain-containing membrane protein